MMKVLHVIASVSEMRGGTSFAVLETVKALQKKGIHAEIATTNDSGSSLLNVPLGQRVLYEETPIHFFPRFSPPVHALREFAFSHPLALWLKQNLTQYDLVHIHALFSMPCTLAMVLARRRGIPYVITPHGLLCHWSLRQSALKKKIYLKLIEQSNLNHSAGLHLNSELEQRDLTALQLKSPSVVIPHGLRVPPPCPDAALRLRTWLQLPPDEPILLFLARLHPKKGLERLIPALARIRHQRFTFIIAGSGDPGYEAELRDRLQEAGLCDRTRMVGFVKGEQKDLLLQGSDLFLLTSYSENFGMAVLEALAAGLPAIVTPGVALSKVVQQHQFGAVPELEEDAIATTILQALNQPAVMKEKGDRARQYVLKHYTWNAIATQLIDVYGGIVGDRLS